MFQAKVIVTFLSVLFFFPLNLSAAPLAGGKLTGPATALAFKDGDVFVGGSFANGAGDAEIKNIARWDSLASRWYPLGSGLDGKVTSLAVRGNDLFVSGEFEYANPSTAQSVEVKKIARYNIDENKWYPINAYSGVLLYPGVVGTVSAVAPKPGSDDLVIAGEMTGVPGLAPGTYKALFYNSAEKKWYNYGFPDYVYEVHDLEWSENGEVLYAGTAEAVYRRSISWEKILQNGGDYNSLLVNGQELYVAGSFKNSNGVDPYGQIQYLYNLAKFDGANWSSIGEPLESSGYVYNYTFWPLSGITLFKDQLYVSGPFLAPNSDLNRRGIAKYSSATNTWLSIDSGFAPGVFQDRPEAPTVLGVEPVQNVLYAGGNFKDASGNPDSDFIAYLGNDSKWKPLLHAASPSPSPTPTKTPNPQGNGGGISKWQGAALKSDSFEGPITGVAAGALITVTEGDTVLGSATTGKNGEFTITFDSTGWEDSTCWIKAELQGFLSVSSYGRSCDSASENFTFYLKEYSSGIPPITFTPSANDELPLAEAANVKGKPGKKIVFNYNLYYSGSASQEIIRIYKRKKIVRTKRGKYFAPSMFSSPARKMKVNTSTLAPGKYRWCITSFDSLERAGEESCAELKIKE